MDMMENRFFGHSNLQGMSAKDRGDASGYTCVKQYGNIKMSGISENIFLGYLYDQVLTESGEETLYHWLSEEEIAEKTLEGWMESKGHKKNLLNPNHEKTGFGIATTKKHQIYITQTYC